jgi:hypothetical protein
VVFAYSTLFEDSGQQPSQASYGLIFVDGAVDFGAFEIAQVRF